MTTDIAAQQRPIDEVHVSDLVAQDPRRAPVFERLGIDYCCGGKLPLSEAARERGLDLDEVRAMLEAATTDAADERDWTQATIQELVTDIVVRHHGFLRAEMPRLTLLAHKVARAHGSGHPELVQAEQIVVQMSDEMRLHTQMEEDEVFPVLLQVGEGVEGDAEEIAATLGKLVEEHTETAEHLERLHGLLGPDFAPPADACTSYRAYLDLLTRFELDLHRHVHKENHVLFEKVMDRLYARGGTPGHGS